MTYLSVCPNCGQWQRGPAGDCVNDCAHRGFAESPRKTLALDPSRRGQVCQRAGARYAGEVPNTGRLACYLCGNTVEQALP